jgi:hypothetical protein
MLTPYDYQFHIIGIILGLIISVIIFFKQIPSRHEKRMRINILATSLSVSLVALGVFLLLGDDFIGSPTQSIWGVDTFRPDISSWSALGTVYPVGIFLSVAGLLGVVMQIIGHKLKKDDARGYVTLAIVLMSIGIVFSFAHTPKYLVRQWRGMRRDSATYISIAIALVLMQQYAIEKHKQIKAI